MVTDSDSDFFSDSDLDDVPLSFPIGGMYSSQPEPAAFKAPAFGGLNLRGDTAVDSYDSSPNGSRTSRAEPGQQPACERVPALPTLNKEPLPLRGTVPGPQGFKLALPGQSQAQAPSASGSFPAHAGRDESKQMAGEPPPTARGVKPPMLFLPNAAAATPVQSPYPSAKGVGRGNGAVGQTRVSLLSTAFMHDSSEAPSSSPRTQQACTHSAIASRCSKALGVGPEEMYLFEIREIPAGADVNSSHVGVMVNNSDATTISTLVQDNKEATSTALTVTVKSTQMEKDLDHLQEKYKLMDQENATLRRLKTSISRRAGNSCGNAMCNATICSALSALSGKNLIGLGPPTLKLLQQTRKRLECPPHHPVYSVPRRKRTASSAFLYAGSAKGLAGASTSISGSSARAPAARVPISHAAISLGEEGSEDDQRRRIVVVFAVWK
eukprot:gene20801-27635_t